MSRDTNTYEALLDRRRRIDGLDEELLRLINERATITSELAEVKQNLGRQVYDPQRERQILSRICDENDGPLDRIGVVNIFCSIIRECRRVEEVRMMKV